MKKYLLRLLLLFAFLFTLPAYAVDYFHGTGYCQQGGHQVFTVGNPPSTTKVQESYPFCTVKVFLTGTTTPVLLYKDDTGTLPLSNPFVADKNGYFSFYVTLGIYDLNFSGSTIVQPFTWTQISIGNSGALTLPLVPAQGGSGTVNPGTGVLLGHGLSPFTTEQPLGILHGGIGTANPGTGVLLGNGVGPVSSENPLAVPHGGLGSANPGTGVLLGNGIGPVTSEQPLAIAHGGSGFTAPSLIPGQNITITGPWPNQIIAAVPTVGSDISVFITTNCNSYLEAAIPAGTFTAQTTITPAAGCYVHGVGRGGATNGATTINFVSTNTPLFNITQDNVHIQGLTLRQIGTPTLGSMGIFQAGNGAGIVGAHADWGLVEDLNINGFFQGVKLAGSGGSFDLRRVQVDANRADGITALGSQGYWDTILVTGNVGNGITLGLCAGACGIGPFMTNIQTFGNGGWGMLSTSQIYLSGGNSYFNNDFLGEIKLTSVPPQSYSGYIKDADVQFAGASVSFGTNINADGILLSTGAVATLDNIHCFNNQRNCVTMSGTQNMISHLFSVGSGQGGVSGYAIQASSGNNSITDSQFGDPVILTGNGNIFRSNLILVSTAVPGLHIGGGINQIIDGNTITNGVGNALQIDASATVNDGMNTIVGNFVNNGARSLNQLPIQGNFYNQSPTTPTIASATTLTPLTAVAFVSGTANIQTIIPKTGFPSQTFCAIPTGAWHTVGGGNIALTSTAISQRVLCFYYTDSDGFWRPSY